MVAAIATPAAESVIASGRRHAADADPTPLPRRLNRALRAPRAHTRAQRSDSARPNPCRRHKDADPRAPALRAPASSPCCRRSPCDSTTARSEEDTSELQSRENLVCRLLLENKKQ